MIFITRLSVRNHPPLPLPHFLPTSLSTETSRAKNQSAATRLAHKQLRNLGGRRMLHTGKTMSVSALHEAVYE
jgi:hypothetical protein